MTDSRLSDAKIQKQIDHWSEQVHKLTDKIDKSNVNKHVLDLSMSTLDDSLDNSKYNSAKSSYSDLGDQIDKLKDKLNKSKSKKTKADLNNQMNDLVKKKASYANQMRTIANQNGFADKYRSRVRMENNRKYVDKLLSALNKQRNHAKSERNRYRTITNNRRKAKIRKRNAPLIAQEAKKAKDNGNTVIYRTDLMDSTVFKLVETSPSETDANDVATKPVDGSTVQTNWISQNNRQYSSTFYLKAKNFTECDTQFRKLMDWSFKYEFTIVGFSRWNHAYITSIAKSTDETISADGMIISITFTYARQAEIKYARTKKSKTKHKAGTKVQQGSHNGKSSNYVRGKPGMTYSQIAKKTGASLSDVLKLNKGDITNSSKVRVRDDS